MALDLDLAGTVDAPCGTRRALMRWLGGALSADALATAVLLTSEPVTNAVVHGRGDIQLRACLKDGVREVSVCDQGPGPARALQGRQVSAGGWGLGLPGAADEIADARR